MNTNAQAPQVREEDIRVGFMTTCQLGNPGDTDWTEATHANQEVQVIAILDCKINTRAYYLVKKPGENFVGRATFPHRRSDDDKIKGVLYCTNGRSYGKGSRGEHFGFMTLEQSAHSLGFDLPL